MQELNQAAPFHLTDWPSHPTPQTARMARFTEHRDGNTVTTRWEAVEIVTARPAAVAPPPAVELAPPRRPGVLALAVLGGAAVLGGLVWAVVWLVQAIVHALAVVVPAALGAVALVALLAWLFTGSGCGGLHCGGCKH